MGCASSTPMMNGGGGIVGAAKHAATDVVHAGEDAMHDVGDGLNDTVGHVKEAMVGAVHGIGQGLDGVLHTATDGVKTLSSTLTAGTTDSGTEYTHIPLKDPTKLTAVDDDENLSEFKETLLQKSANLEMEAADGVDDFMKETADMVEDKADALDAVLAESMSEAKAVAGVSDEDARTATPETVVDHADGGVSDGANNKTPTHSLDSLRTSSPDPEIERALANTDGRKGASPEPTINELGELEKAAAASLSGNDDQQRTPQQLELIAKYSKYFSEAQRAVKRRQQLQPTYVDVRLPDNSDSAGDGSTSNNNPAANAAMNSDDSFYHTMAEIDASAGGDFESNAQRENGGILGQMVSKSDLIHEQVTCGLTQWELLADAILATPVTRFIENPPANNNGKGTDGMLDV